jgi:hypothetical protein
MEKLFINYLMNNIIDDVNDTKQNINLIVSEKRREFIDKKH